MNRPFFADPTDGVPPNSDTDARFFSSPFFIETWKVFQRRKWYILGTISAVVLLGLLVIVLMTPQYTAIGTLEIRRESDRIVNVQGVQPDTSAMDLEFYQTQYGLLQSQSLAEAVATELRLYDDAKFFALLNEDALDKYFNQGRPVSRAVRDRQERIRAAGEILLEHISVEPRRLSRLVNISFTSPDPALSARIVNVWMEQFIRTTLERRFDATSYAREFLSDQLEDTRLKLEDSERRLVTYATRQRIINVEGGASSTAGPSGDRPLVVDDLTTLNRKLAEATAERMAAETRLMADGTNTVEALENIGISEMRARRAELAVEYAKMLEQFEPDYPPAKILATQLDALSRAIAGEEGRVEKTLEATYKAAVANEQRLMREVEELKNGLLDFRKRSIQYNILQREVDTNRQIYAALLQRFKEIGVAGGVGVNNISVVDSAKEPNIPSRPRPLLYTLIALILGGLVAAVVAFILEQFDDSIADPKELERVLGLPLLGTAPKAIDDPSLAIADRKSPLSEAYMSIQTSLGFATAQGLPRTLSITSSRPTEGKSTSALGIALSLARSGKRVLLIDGDMRSPTVHRQFELTNEAGLSSVLSGQASHDSVIARNAAPGLAVMSAGPIPPNPAELLSGNRLRIMLDKLRHEFDHIVVDGPPVMGLADAPLIASQVEGVVFIVQAEKTRMTFARVAVSRLRTGDIHLLGTVLTKFSSNRGTYGYGFDYGYGRAAEASQAA